MNNTAINIHFKISLQDTDFISFGYIPRSGTAELDGSSTFNFLRNLYSLFDAGRDWGQEEKGMTEDKMAGWYHQINGHEFE